MTRLRFIFTLAFAFLSALVNVSTAASAQQKTDVTGKWAFAGMPGLFFEGVLVDANNMTGSLEMGGLGSATFTGTRQK